MLSMSIKLHNLLRQCKRCGSNWSPEWILSGLSKQPVLQVLQLISVLQLRNPAMHKLSKWMRLLHSKIRISVNSDSKLRLLDWQYKPDMLQNLLKRPVLQPNSAHLPVLPQWMRYLLLCEWSCCHTDCYFGLLHWLSQQRLLSIM